MNTQGKEKVRRVTESVIKDMYWLRINEDGYKTYGHIDSYLYKMQFSIYAIKSINEEVS